MPLKINGYSIPWTGLTTVFLAIFWLAGLSFQSGNDYFIPYLSADNDIINFDLIGQTTNFTITPLPENDIWGVVWDGSNLWAVGQTSNNLYLLEINGLQKASSQSYTSTFA